MIEINLIPGSRRIASQKSLSASFSLKDWFGRLSIDKYTIAAGASVLLSSLVVFSMVTSQHNSSSELKEREEQAVSDSMSYASVLRERTQAIALRDSVLKQVTLINSIDRMRYTWAHVLDEINIALPPYTWLASIVQLTPADIIDPKDSSSAKPGSTPATLPVNSTGKEVTFRLVGQTVDIQALTLFMKQLAASPFFQNVQLGRSDLVISMGKPVTEFQLEITTREASDEFIQTSPLNIVVSQ